MMKKQQTQGWLRIFHHPTRISKLSKPVTMLALAGATLFAGCSKDDKKDEIVPQHDTVYEYAQDWWQNLENVNQISASADSVEVHKIIFKAAGNSFYNTNFAYKDIKEMFENAFRAAKGKGFANDTLKDVRDTEGVRAVEPQYKAWGIHFQYRQR